MVHDATLQRGHELDIVVQDPSSAVALGLEAVHYATGAPWWLVVPCAAFAVRAAVHPLLALQRNRSRRLLEPLGPDLSRAGQALARAWRDAPSSGARATAVRAWLVERQRILRRCEAGHVARNALVYAYLGVAITHVMGLRYAISIDPAFGTEGALWFVSLAAHDAWLRLAALASVGSVLSMGRPPEHALGRLVHGAVAASSVALLPLAHWLQMPEGIALHVCGVVGFRLTAKGWGWLRQRFGSAPVTQSAPAKNPRW